jgi:3-hydroxyisobutyrate dehydrogenase
MSGNPSATRIGWIGTGVMGAAMCGHLLGPRPSRHGFHPHAGARRRALARGAVWADSPRAAAAGADVVFTMVGFPHDVREVVSDPTARSPAPRPARCSWT